MPGQSRRKTMDPRKPGIFHITSNCVRGAFLCGKDIRSGKDYSHRREFIKSQIQYLAQHFAIAVGWEGIMSNHLHLVLANLPNKVDTCSDAEVLRRVCKIFRYKFRQLGVQDCEPTDEQIEEFSGDAEFMREMRLRLSDPSWFMRQLLQKLAVLSNREDDCRGHFVDRRFKHRVITDERGILICGIYVDLNEIAAMEVDRPELSMNTSAGMRIAGKLLRDQGRHAEAQRHDGHLLPIHRQGDGQGYPAAGTPGAGRVQDEGLLDIKLDQYLEMLDAYGRELRPGKRGKIPLDLPPILERLNLSRESLLHMVENYDKLYPNAVGSGESLARLSDDHGGLWSGQAAAVLAAEQAFAEQAEEPLSSSKAGSKRAKSCSSRVRSAKKKRK